MVDKKGLQVGLKTLLASVPGEWKALALSIVLALVPAAALFTLAVVVKVTWVVVGLLFLGSVALALLLWALVIDWCESLFDDGDGK